MLVLAGIRASHREGLDITLQIQQLKQLTVPTWDGEIISKTARDQLAEAGLVGHTHGWNFLTERGVEICVALGLLRS